jgi:formylglycine-generating enzyme required for sulfatase activity
VARIFLCHASEDKAQVREVYHRLRAIDGFEPWLDEEDLLSGQDWTREIPRTLRTSDFILIFFSRLSVAKRGYVQREMKLALDTLQEIPEGTIHTIPVRLDDCEVPDSFRHYHYANLFDPHGFDRIVHAIRAEIDKRPDARPSVARPPSQLAHARATDAPERPPPATRVATWRAWIKHHPLFFSLIAFSLLVVAVALAWKGSFPSKPLDVTGHWTTDVLTRPDRAKDEFTRSFVFEMKGDIVLGSTRLKSVHRKYGFYNDDIKKDILGGTMKGNMLSFYTPQHVERPHFEGFGTPGPPQWKIDYIDYKIWYYGTVTNDTIEFTMQSDNPQEGPPTQKFVVKRVPPSPAGQGAASPASGTQMGGECAPSAPPATAEASTWRSSIGMEFRLIPAGEFLMGSEKGQANPDGQQPVHKVCLTKPFYLGTYEVTQAQWKQVMGNNPSEFKGDPNRPVETVSWSEVQEFIRRLNAQEHRTHYRLPTEAEWEYAARAGTTTTYSFGDDPGPLEEYAWCDPKVHETHPVGQKRPNAWGLHDMLGNVEEWVQDWYAYYGSEAMTDPQGSEETDPHGEQKVVRGGSYPQGAWYCQSAYRSSENRGRKDRYIGFRLLRTAE